MALIRYSPFAELDPFVGFKALEDSMKRMFAEPNGRPWVPPVDILENENELVVKADVPDVKFEDIDVKLENGTLTIAGERKFEKQSGEKGGWHRIERSYGTFERSFSLPETVDPEKVKADYVNGTLTVTLPKKELAKPRQVKVEVKHN
jgi:HSP20 family protein